MAESTCHLLKLPGELRNRIYEYAREDDPIGVHVAQLPNSAGTTSWIHNRPSFLSLAQTCRQLREEFRPIYMEHTAFCMRLLDSYTFVKAFVTPHGETARGNMIVDFGYGLAHLETNVLPLLQQLRKLPHLAAHAHYTDNDICKNDLNTLLDVHAGKWFDNIAADVSRITLRKRGQGDLGRLDISFEVKNAQRWVNEKAGYHVHQWFTYWKGQEHVWFQEKGLAIEGLTVRLKAGG